MATVNPDLAKARSSASFSPDDVTTHIHGRLFMERRLAAERAANDPAFKIAERFSTMDRPQVYNEAVRMFPEYLKKCKEYGYTNDQYNPSDNARPMFYEFGDAVFGEDHPFNLHLSMFATTLETQATEEQKQRWLPKALAFEIIGTYAQTEMGHGTFLRGLETTATLDRRTDELIIHSPTVSSCKYWPGGLGKTANHAIIMAKLIVDEKSYGLHMFLVQLRDIETHSPVEGVEVGDINEKFGFKAADNGYLRFTHKRIPRTNMLMRYTQLDKEGNYKRDAPPELTYLSMVTIRVFLVLGSAKGLSAAATIATRYSAVRRQTANSHGVEPQILDYQTQQMKLMPAISASYGFYFTSIKVRQIYDRIFQDLENGDTSRLAEIHNLSSGLKAYCCELATELAEVCRRACGGHGYSHASGIPKILLRLIPSCTYEGENTVMYLQCARSLMKFYGKAQAGESVPAMLTFLSLPPVIPKSIQNATEFDIPTLIIAYRYNALMAIHDVANQMEKYSMVTTDPDTMWNAHSQTLIEVARSQSMHITASMFAEKLEDPTWEPRALAVMKLVCEFFLVHNIIQSAGTFMQNGVVNKPQMKWLEARRVELLTLLRPEAVGLVDAFDHSDRTLNSCLGRWDGNVYEALYEYAKSSSLNQTQVHPSFEKYVKPMRAYIKSHL